MSKHNIILSLNDREKIVIELEEQLRVVHCCYRAPMTLCFEDKTYPFSNESISDNMQGLILMLEKALENKLHLHPSIKDIGLAKNEYFQDKPGIIYKKDKEDKSYWVGYDNQLYSGKGLYIWLYNNLDGSIILELTPAYSDPVDDPEDKQHYIPYEEWAKNYKPYAIRIIPRDVAQQWLNQARDILNQIDENTKKEKAIYVNDDDKELTDEWVRILKEEYGFEDPWEARIENKIPAEFHTDEWWKKRGL
jgi:hypothetical protein